MRTQIVILFFAFLAANASGKTAPPDSSKKLVYSEIVKVDSTNRFELYKKAAKWMAQQGFEIELEDPLVGKITAKNRFVVYTDKSVLAKPNGDFSHDVVIEIKEGKYRYTFSDFKYRKYVQDRQDLLKYVPVKGSKPIEESSAPGWKKQWTKNKMQVNNKVTGYINSLKDALKYVPPIPILPEKPKEEW